MNAPAHDSSLRHGLSDAQWSVAGHLLNRLVKGPGRPSGGNRLFLHAVLWMARAGRHGETCPPNLGIGGPFMPDSFAGRARAFGAACSRSSPIRARRIGFLST